MSKDKQGQAVVLDVKGLCEEIEWRARITNMEEREREYEKVTDGIKTVTTPPPQRHRGWGSI